MALTYTPRFGLIQWGAGTDAYTRAEANAALSTIETLGAIDITVADAAHLPAPGVRGRYIWQTDDHLLYRDTGSALVLLHQLPTDPPAALSPSTAGAAGNGLAQARDDHGHDMLPWAAAGDLDVLTFGQAAAAGTNNTKTVRPDHGHAMPTHTKADHDALNIDADTLDGLSSADFDPASPAGEVRMFAGALPAGWLACDGSTRTRTVWPNLFAAIGITWGNGDNSGTTFSLPDLRGRVPVGAGHGPGLTSRAVGDTFGEETHVLTTGELANHNHAVTDPTHNHGGSANAHNHGINDPGHIHTLNDPGHGHTMNDPTHLHGGGLHHHLPDNFLGGDFIRVPGAGPHGLTQTNVTAYADLYTETADSNIATSNDGAGQTANGSATGIGVNGHTSGVTTTNTAPTITADNTGITLAAAGAGTAHNNLPPSGVLTFAIKT